jgi:hypothetical protein
MKPENHKTPEPKTCCSPFWVCLFVFVLLGCDYGFRFANLWEQRDQLNHTVLMQTQNLGMLAQARQLEARLEAFSLDLLEISKTNATAKQIVQDFNIQWTPGPNAALPAAAAPGAATTTGPVLKATNPETAAPSAPAPAPRPAGTNK